MRTIEEIRESAKKATMEQLLNQLEFAGSFQMNDRKEDREFGNEAAKVIKAEILGRMRGWIR